jgi:uncharacterized protein (DUF736 family)
MPVKSNEVGAAWTKVGRDSGRKYLSVSLNLDKLMDVTNGLTNGKVTLRLFPKRDKKEGSNAPDFDLVYAPPQSASQGAPRGGDGIPDEDIPF